MAAAGLPLQELVRKLCDGPDSMSSITLHQLFVFITVISRVKNDIILTQPTYLSDSTPPAFLPPVIVSFLADCCQLTTDEVEHTWGTLKATVWCNVSDYHQGPRGGIFAKYGHERGLSECFAPLAIHEN